MARRNTFGTIRQLPSGRWQARLTASSGQVPAPGTFPTRKAISDWLARQLADRSRGLVFAPDAGRELLKDYAGA